MSNPDVKVRVSGEDEGVTQLLRALQQALRDADREQRKNADGAKQNAKAQQDTARSTAAAVDSFAALERTLHGIAGALAAQKIAQLVLDSAAAGNEMAKLAEKTGAGVEALSVLTVAAEDAELSQQDLGTGLKFLQKSLVDLKSGSASTVAAFRSIGLTAKDLDGLTTDQAFLRIANAMAQFRDGAGKTDAALTIFGRSGSELIPLLNSLAGDGFDQAADRAKALGLVMSEEDVRAAQAFDDAMDTLTDTAKGVAQTVTASVLPALTSVVTLATSLFQDIPQDARTFGVAFAVVEGGVIALTFAVRALASGLREVAAAEGAVALGLSATGMGAVIVTLGLLAAAIVTYIAEQRAAAAAVQAANRDTATSAARARDLTRAYEVEARTLADATTTAQQKHAAEQRLARIKADLIALGPDYAAALDKEAQGYRAVLDAIKAVQGEHVRKLVLNEIVSANDVETARARLGDAQRAVEAVQDALSRGFPVPSSALENAKTVAKRAKDSLEASIAVHSQAIDALKSATGVTASEPSKPDVGTAPAAVTALANQRLAAARDAAQRELAAQQSANADAQQLNDRFYQAGLRSQEEFYAQKLALAERATAAEVAALETQRAALATAPLSTDAKRDATADEISAARLEREQALGALTAQIARRQEDGARTVIGLVGEEARAREALDAQILAHQAKIRAAKQDTLATTIAGIHQEAEAFDRELQQKGFGEADRTLQVKVFVDTLTAQAQFAELKRQADAILNSTGPERARIEQQVAAHLLTQEAGEQRIAALERARKPELVAILTQMQGIAGALGPDAQAHVAQFAAQIAGLGAVTSRVEQLQRDFGPDVRASLESNLGTFLGSTIDQVHNLADAFRQLALTVLQSIDQVVAKLLAARIVEGIADTLLGGGGGLSNSQLASLSARVPGVGLTPGHAVGGYISGPGTGTSDSIAARLSNGEYVIRAAAVEKVGVPYLDWLNGMQTPRLRSFAPRVPRFADGGLVAAGAGGGSFDGELRVSADRGVIAEIVHAVLRGADGEQAVLRHVVNNRRLLGG